MTDKTYTRQELEEMADQLLTADDKKKVDSMLRTPNCPFVLFVGTKKLVKRKEFEQFISEKLVI